MLALHILHCAFRRLCIQLPRCTTVTTTRALTLYLWEPFRKILVFAFSLESSPQHGARKRCVLAQSLSTFVKCSTDTPSPWQKRFRCQLFCMCRSCMELWGAQQENLQSMKWYIMQPYDLRSQIFGWLQPKGEVMKAANS